MTSVHVRNNRVGLDLADSQVAGARHQQLDYSVEPPLVGVLQVDPRADYIECIGAYHGLKGIAPFNGQYQWRRAAASGSRVGPGEDRTVYRCLRGQAAVVHSSRNEMSVDQIADRRDRRRRSNRVQIIRGQAGSETGALAGGVAQFLFQIEGSAEIENPHDKNHQQGQGDGEFEQLRTRSVSQQKGSPPANSTYERRHQSSPAVWTSALS